MIFLISLKEILNINVLLTSNFLKELEQLKKAWAIKFVLKDFLKKKTWAIKFVLNL